MFKFIVALAAVAHSVSACPGSSNRNLRQEEVAEIHQALDVILGTEQQEGLASMNLQANGPLFPTCARLAGAPLKATEAKIRAAYAGLRTDYYALVDKIIVGSPNAEGAPGIPAKNAPLNREEKQFRFANIIGSAARLAFHDAGEVDVRSDDAFGSDGCLSDSDANSGMKESTTITMTIIERYYQKYCDKISRADFWVLFGKIALESALPNGRFAANQGVANPLVAGQNADTVLNIPFQWGRKDAAGSCDAGANRLPDHLPGLSEFKKSFVDQMGLTIRDGVILSGAHSVGHVHTQFSGFGHADPLASLEQNPLTNAWDETPYVFDNMYYDSLAGKFWLNNDFEQDVIGSPPKDNRGANYWGVQLAEGEELQPVPQCSLTFPPTCGADLNDNIFCTTTAADGVSTKHTTTGNNLAWTQIRDKI